MNIKEYIDPILDSFDEALCISDEKGIITYVNTPYESLMHIKKKEVIGKNVNYLVETGVVDMVVAPEVIQTKSAVSIVQNLEFGKKLLLQGIPIMEDNQVKLVVTVLKDQTKISELREQLDILQTLYSAAPKTSSKKKPVVLGSPAIKKVYRQLNSLADTDVTVLILGDTGVGKEVFARKLHANSKRVKCPFVKVDCGCLPENLIESELFGYAPGAFSGGKPQGKMGLIESANTGTVFLDEVGELPLMMQTRLLRVLQDREILRIGDTVPRPVDVRFVAATNRDIQKFIEEGRFRSDLYYRLKVAEIKIPSIHERGLDIIPLVKNYLNYYCALYSRNVSFTSDAEQALMQYEWPGNVREIENFVLKTVVEAQKKLIHFRDLPPRMRTGLKGSMDMECDLNRLCRGKSLKEIREAVEKQVLEHRFKKYKNISALAKALDTERTTVSRKLKKYGIP